MLGWYKSGLYHPCQNAEMETDIEKIQVPTTAKFEGRDNFPQINDILFFFLTCYPGQGFRPVVSETKSISYGLNKREKKEKIKNKISSCMFTVGQALSTPTLVCSIAIFHILLLYIIICHTLFHISLML